MAADTKTANKDQWYKVPKVEWRPRHFRLTIATMPATTEVRPTMTWRPTIIRKSRDIEGIGSPATLVTSSGIRFEPFNGVRLLP